jgi:hypothetical protein
MGVRLHQIKGTPIERASFCVAYYVYVRLFIFLNHSKTEVPSLEQKMKLFYAIRIFT